MSSSDGEIYLCCTEDLIDQKKNPWSEDCRYVKCFSVCGTNIRCMVSHIEIGKFEIGNDYSCTWYPRTNHIMKHRWPAPTFSEHATANLGTLRSLLVDRLKTQGVEDKDVVDKLIGFTAQDVDAFFIETEGCGTAGTTYMGYKPIEIEVFAAIPQKTNCEQ